MTPNLIPNLMAGNQGQASKSIQAMGQIPVGNAGGSNGLGPTGINDIAQPAAGLGGVTANPIMQTAAPSSGTLIGGGAQGAIPVSQQQASDKQLTDVYGKGIGGDINSVINNLGSNDSTYMQAYESSMAQPNAENLATLNTTLGNAGVGANSSTQAIADADFETGVTSQEGLQEAQLQQTDEQNLIGLLSSTEGAANKEASTSVWGDIGSVLSAVGTDAAAVAPFIG